MCNKPFFFVIDRSSVRVIGVVCAMFIAGWGDGGVEGQTGVQRRALLRYERVAASASLLVLKVLLVREVDL
jgi:hypothetical protein